MAKLSTYPQRTLANIAGVDASGNVGLTGAVAISSTFANTSVAPNLPTLYPNASTYSLNSITSLDTTGLNTSSGTVNSLTISMHYGGSTINSTRQALYVEGNLFAPSSNLNGNYVAGTFFQSAGSNDGGILGAEKGSFFGMNPVAYAYAAATHLQEVAGMEVNIGIESGASTIGKAGISIVQLASDRVQGSAIDAALWTINQSGAPGWQHGILFSAPSFSSSATIIATAGTSTVAGGIDLTSYTFTGNAIASPSFSVDGSGNVTGLSLKNIPIAVSALPSASTSGVRTFVNNSNVVASGNFGAIVAGGGANTVPVYSDGTNWRIQ